MSECGGSKGGGSIGECSLNVASDSGHGSETLSYDGHSLDGEANGRARSHRKARKTTTTSCFSSIVKSIGRTVTACSEVYDAGDGRSVNSFDFHWREERGLTNKQKREQRNKECTGACDAGDGKRLTNKQKRKQRSKERTEACDAGDGRSVNSFDFHWREERGLTNKQKREQRNKEKEQLHYEQGKLSKQPHKNHHHHHQQQQQQEQQQHQWHEQSGKTLEGEFNDKTNFVIIRQTTVNSQAQQHNDRETQSTSPGVDPVGHYVNIRTVREEVTSLVTKPK